MNSVERQKKIAKGGLLLLILLFTGCSLFRKPQGEKLPSGAFRNYAVVQNQIVPIPVEIAEDESSPTESADDIPSTTLNSSQRPQLATANQLGRGGLAEQVRSESKASTGADERQDTEDGQDEEQYHPKSQRKKFKLLTKFKESTQRKSVRYRIRRGDTLMKIAFANYGDILKWKDIFEQNRALLGQPEKIPVGAEIWIAGGRFRVIQKNGVPYLIKVGDTLIRISNQVYGTGSHWRKIWKNNLDLIRDPNRIYAGFTLYYPKDSSLPTGPQSRVLSSEK